MTVLNGVISLLDDLGSAVAEAARTTRPDGIVAVADLTANGDQRVTSANNTFWTADDVVAALERAGCVVDYVACGEPGIGDWASVQRRWTTRSGVGTPRRRASSSGVTTEHVSVH